MDLDLDAIAKLLVAVFTALTGLVTAFRTGRRGAVGGSTARIEETVTAIASDVAEIAAAQQRTDAKVSVVLAWQGRHETEHVRR